MKPGHWRKIILGFVAMLVAMVTVFVLVLELAEGDWRPVEAEVQATRIKSSRPGTLAWALMVDFSYTVAGKNYDKQGFDVFRDAEWEVTRAQQLEWPKGKKFEVYYSSDAPGAVSLARDGGREALAVMASILTPLAMAFFGLIFFLVRYIWVKKEQ